MIDLKMIRTTGVIALLLLLMGCETAPYDDGKVDIKLPDSGQVASVEEEGDMICVTETNGSRMCVPKVHEEEP